MAEHYTDEKTALIVLALLKKHGIRKVVTSPGATNAIIVASMQTDPYFEMYSSVDERSAAYIACGMAEESGEPVVLSCTGATASRNYPPGLTEAYYRKLPILALTSTQIVNRVGHHIAQVVDRSVIQNDIAKLSVTLPLVHDDDTYWECEVKTNQAILEMKRHGGGPVHINLPTNYSKRYDVKALPECRMIDRLSPGDKFPDFPDGKVAIFIGSHKRMDKKTEGAIDAFCASHNAVVFCDHTSSYKGKYRVLYAAVAGQQCLDVESSRPDLLIHIGEVSGDYYSIRLAGREVWRVNPDGEIRDTFRKLRYVFEMPEHLFFETYTKAGHQAKDDYLQECRAKLTKTLDNLPDLPFSNPWLASRMASRIPDGSVIHFAILNSLRSWNFFELPESVESACNVGGFGIDGCVSSLLGASLACGDKLYFGVIGDLALFYDMNSLGNRQVGKNLRILLVNNGRGTEFRQYNHHAAAHGADTDEFIAAAGHFGNKSPELIKHFAQDLGFEYICAKSKEEFEAVYMRFLVPEITDRPMLFEIFTDSDDESRALEQMLTIHGKPKSSAKQLAKQALGRKGVSVLKKALGKE